MAETAPLEEASDEYVRAEAMADMNELEDRDGVRDAEEEEP